MTSSYDPLAEASWSITGSNVNNVLEIGSTLPGTIVRVFTNESAVKGHFIGSSNIGQTDNYFYIATQTSSNVGRVDLSVRNGNIGVGQATPTAKLHVTGGDIWMTGSNQFLWGDSGKVIVDNTGVIDADAISADVKTQWNNDGTSNLNYTRGRVAINRTAPEYELDVAGTIRTTDITMSSDRRLKREIEELEPDACMQLLEGLRPVRYDWNASNLKPSTGFIAQEVLEHVKGTPFEDYLLRRPDTPFIQDTDPMWSVNYLALLAPMIQVMKQMQRRITELESKL